MSGAPAAVASRDTGGPEVVAFAVLVAAAMVTVPARVHLAAAAAGGGYDPSVAHLVLVAAAGTWAALHLLRGAMPVPASPVPAGLPAGRRREARLVGLAVFGACLLLYFPPFLARYGPLGEDKYFLSSLLRLLDGQRPYADFEFIYGPLLLLPLAGWTAVAGYSLASYYWFLALVEAATWGAVAVGLGRLIPDRRSWLLALAALAIVLVNDNFGLSWIVLRRLLPLLVLLSWALWWRDRRRWAVPAALFGVQLLVSLEYAAASGAALGGAALVEALAARRLEPVWRGARIGLLGCVIGAAGALLLMGGEAAAWLAATWRIVVLRGGGEAGFAYHPSVNGLAVLVLLFLACAAVGAGLRRRGATFEAGDRFLLASLGYALVAMKSGLARSDMYHLVPPVLGLIGAVLLPLPTAVFAVPAWHRRLRASAVAVICATYLPGLVAGGGRLWAQALALGARDVLTGRPASSAVPVRSRLPVLGPERTEADPAWMALAEYFGDTERAGVPVVFYERSWGLDRHIGVAKPVGVYPTDDYLVSDEKGLEVRRFLEAHPEALVIVSDESWAYLTVPGPEPAYTSMFWFRRVRSLPVRFLEYWSSSHFGTATIEERVRKRDRWARTVGRWLAEHYAPRHAVGDVVVLGRVR